MTELFGILFSLWDIFLQSLTSFSLTLNSRAAAQLLVSSAALITWSLNAAVYCFLLEVISVAGGYLKLIIFLYTVYL